MIQATFKKKNDVIYWYKIDGHANYAKVGSDIVCAGVSSLYIAITNALLELGHTYERDGGYFVLDGKDKEAICLKVLFDGVSDIAKQYPEYCQVAVID